MNLLAASTLGLSLLLQQQDAAPIQRESPAPTILKVESRLVPVAVNVTDEHGTPISGLTKDDFEVSEDTRPQRIAVFDRDATTPLQIVIAVDASESTYSDTHLERDAMKSFVKSIVRAQDSVSLLSFADNVTEVVPFTNDSKRIDSGFSRIEHGAATAVYDAIYLAGQRLSEQPTKGQRRVIVMITDGVNTTRHGTYDAALEEAQRAGAMLYALIVIPVVADAGRNTGGEHALIQIARDTGGKYYEIIDKHDITPAFEHVSDDLRTQYTIGYYAPQKALGADSLRHIEIRLKDPALRAKYTLRYRNAYYGH